jgi:hypothetical protein
MSIILLLFVVLLILAVVFSFIPTLSRYAIICLALAVVLLSILTGVLHL